MSAMEKSDLRANKAASAAAELVERRSGARENGELQSTVRTQSRIAVSQAQARIREAAFRRTGPPHQSPSRNDRGSPPPFVRAYRARVGHEKQDPYGFSK